MPKSEAQRLRAQSLWPFKLYCTQALFTLAALLFHRTVQPVVILLQYEPDCGTVAGTHTAVHTTMKYLFTRVSRLGNTESLVTSWLVKLFWTDPALQYPIIICKHCQDEWMSGKCHGLCIMYAQPCARACGWSEPRQGTPLPTAAAEERSAWARFTSCHAGQTSQTLELKWA